MFAWPVADISVMAPSVAVNVIAPAPNSTDPAVLAAHAQRQAALRDALQSVSTPWRAAGLGDVDDVIPAKDTRQVLINAIRLARGNRGLGAHRLAAWPTSF